MDNSFQRWASIEGVKNVKKKIQQEHAKGTRVECAECGWCMHCNYTGAEVHSGCVGGTHTHTHELHDAYFCSSPDFSRVLAFCWFHAILLSSPFSHWLISSSLPPSLPLLHSQANHVPTQNQATWSQFCCEYGYVMRREVEEEEGRRQRRRGRGRREIEQREEEREGDRDED